MKDTKKEIRNGIYTSLNGIVEYDNAAVPIYEEMVPSNVSPDLFILLKGQQETTEENNDNSFITKSSIDIEITQKTGSNVSKDVVDDVYNAVMEILLPTPSSIGFTIDAAFQLQNGFRESCATDTVAVTETETVITERIRLSFTITQK